MWSNLHFKNVLSAAVWGLDGWRWLQCSTRRMAVAWVAREAGEREDADAFGCVLKMELTGFAYRLDARKGRGMGAR